MIIFQYQRVLAGGCWDLKVTKKLCCKTLKCDSDDRMTTNAPCSFVQAS